MNLKQHIESKTNGGLIILLACVVGLALAGKLTPDVVDAIKWFGVAFFGVRASANVAENLPGSKTDSGESDK